MQPDGQDGVNIVELTELTVYAREKYHITEEFPWKDLPGFSVLSNPRTGRRIALLIRHWSWETGDMIQCCDLKCADAVRGIFVPFLMRPFHMRGRKWVGIRMADERVDRETVFRLFDVALKEDVPQPYTTIVLKDPAGTDTAEDSVKNSEESPARVYRETSLPPVRKEFPSQPGIHPQSGRQGAFAPKSRDGNRGAEKDLHPTGPNMLRSGSGFRPEKEEESKENSGPRKLDLYFRTPEDSKEGSSFAGEESGYPEVPEKIREMWNLYEYGYSSFYLKCRNFYRQGKFMESYEDDEPWNGSLRRFFPTYHDLNLRQLRGYFTWRTRLRKGRFEPVAMSLAYIYLYELLSGIGTRSPEDAAQKMQDFERGFLDAGFGDDQMRRNLRHWRMEYSILHNLPAEEDQRFLNLQQLEQDTMLEVLKYPDKYSDEEVYNSLREFDPKRLPLSPVIQKDPARGKHLFSLVWQQAVKGRNGSGKNVFTALFGEVRTIEWKPLRNAVYWEEPDQNADEKTFTYPLNRCRSYHCRHGKWTEEYYDGSGIRTKEIRSLLREMDGMLRRALKTGRYLKANPEMSWAAPFVQAALKEEKKENEQKRISSIAIDFTHLDRIRRDAAVTRDTLLTPEEMGAESQAMEGPAKGNPESETTEVNDSEIRNPAGKGSGIESSAGRAAAIGKPSAEAETSGTPEENASAEKKSGKENPEKEKTSADSDTETEEENANIQAASRQESDASSFYREILQKILRGEHPEKEIRAAHRLPSIVTDAINEALYEEVGDTVLVCEDDIISIVEDYREDVEELLESGEDI